MYAESEREGARCDRRVGRVRGEAYGNGAGVSEKGRVQGNCPF